MVENPYFIPDKLDLVLRIITCGHRPTKKNDLSAFRRGQFIGKLKIYSSSGLGFEIFRGQYLKTNSMFQTVDKWVVIMLETINIYICKEKPFILWKKVLNPIVAIIEISILLYNSLLPAFSGFIGLLSNWKKEKCNMDVWCKNGTLYRVYKVNPILYFIFTTIHKSEIGLYWGRWR